MADSDDESERRRRDKFRRERSDNDNRRRPGDKREPFDDRPGIGGMSWRDDHRAGGEIQGHFERKHSPLAEPPYKRFRKDQNTDYRSQPYKRREVKRNDADESEALYRSPVIPFKRFLEPLDDFISEDDACIRYKEYKDSYTKKHIEEYFEAHKNEEWLRLRYHPDFMDVRRELITNSVKHRLSVFMELLDKKYLENQAVQMDNSEQLIKLMDAVVIKLEGGTDNDLKVLDENVSEFLIDDEIKKQSLHLKDTPFLAENRSDGEAGSVVEDFDKMLQPDSTLKQTFLKRKSSELYSNTSLKQKMSSDGEHSESSQNSESNSDSSCDEEEDDDLDENCIKTEPRSCGASDLMCESKERELVRETEYDVPTPTTAEAPEGLCANDAVFCSTDALGSSPTPDALDKQLSVTHQQDVSEAPRPLHKTASIFFRALPSTIKEDELRQLCESQPGFKRIALWEPVPERRFMRHAWATYEPTVNIKKICWALNTSSVIRDKLDLPNGELGATVNRDLAQRVRPLTPLSRHKPVMRQDLLLAAQLIARLDRKHKLWLDSGDAIVDTIDSSIADQFKSGRNEWIFKGEAFELAIKSNNPLLKNLTDYLVDEGGSEEEALLGESQSENIDEARNTATVPIESDLTLARALDLLILYLRIVHSVDYYVGVIYPMEDFMPHRCGIFHARGDRGLNSVPGSRSVGLTYNRREIEDYMHNFSSKLRALIDIPKDLTEEELKKLGMRDPEKAVEDFIEANIQKRTGKKKPFKVVWVCPLSDKKFREPIFVRKHIFNKHMEKVEAAKKDNAIFFNNYLKDPLRPSLPEAPYNLVNQYYSSVNSNHLSRGHRGSGRGYRGGYRNNNSLLPSSRGGYHDYYDVASHQHQHQAMAAVAAAAAAAFYPSATAADLYALATAGAPRSGMGQRRGRGSPHNDYGNRSHGDTRRRHVPYGSNRRAYGSNDRGMVSYNDLDDPNNDGI